MSTKKIVLLGHFGVGKTSLIRRYIDNTFTKDYKVTIGVHVSKKNVEVAPNELVSLIIWDIEGNEDILNARQSYLKGSHSFIYVFDLSRPKTYSTLQKDIEFLKTNFNNVIIKIVGNKMDLITKDFAKKLSEELPYPVDYFISAKLGSRVETLFSKLAKELH